MGCQRPDCGVPVTVTVTNCETGKVETLCPTHAKQRKQRNRMLREAASYARMRAGRGQAR